MNIKYLSKLFSFKKLRETESNNKRSASIPYRERIKLETKAPHRLLFYSKVNKTKMCVCTRNLSNYRYFFSDQGIFRKSSTAI